MATTPAALPQKNTETAGNAKAPDMTPAQKAMNDWAQNQYTLLSKGRYAEEREWYQNGLFDQLRQWLDEDPTTGKLRPRKQDSKNPKPMPVSNHFSATIALNANALGAAIPDMIAEADNYDAKNRRAAEAAERAVIAANLESGMEVLNPILAKHNVLWGLGVTKDTIDMSQGTEQVPSIQTQPVLTGYQCPVCGYQEPAGQQAQQVPAGGDPSLGGQDASSSGASRPFGSGAPGNLGTASPRASAAGMGGVQNSAAGSAGVGRSLPQGTAGSLGAAGQGGGICPQCGQGQLQPVMGEQEVPGESTEIPTARIKTRIPTIFEVYVPRDCQDANLSPLVIEVYPRNIGDLRADYPDFVDSLQPDGAPQNGSSLSQFYIQSLRRLTFGGSTPLDQDKDQATVTEVWVKWTRLPKDVQDAIAEEWQNEPSERYSEKAMTQLEAAQAYGVMMVSCCNMCLEMMPWYNEEHNPYTFFPFQKDVANPYPKGLAVELVPLQKQLNRLDSLIERALMANSAGKWIIPISQTRTDLTGDPNDVLQYDDDENKRPPQFINTNPISAAVFQRRATIVQEFQALGYTSSIDRGDTNGGAGGVFRTLAYLGSKAEESRKTQRYLWEQAHELRARKLLKLAMLCWDEPRKVRVAGFNNQFGAQEISKADLQGDYEITVVQDSSRPKTVDEKLSTIQTLLQGGLVNPEDPDVRDYILDSLGESDIDLVDHLAYVKAERDLEQLKQGVSPYENPYMNWQIEMRIFAQYIQTEEFEDQAQNIKMGILMWAQYCQFKLAPPLPPPGAMPPGPPKPGGPPDPHAGAHKVAGALGTPKPGHVLHGVPGQQFSPQKVQSAAATEGQQVVDALPENQPTRS